MGGAKHEVALVTVLEAHELGAVGADAAALLPERGVHHDGGQELLGPERVHLVAHDGLDLVQGADGQRQVRVEAGRLLADHAGTQQQTMARELRLGRVLLERGRVEPGHVHGPHGQS